MISSTVRIFLYSFLLWFLYLTSESPVLVFFAHCHPGRMLIHKPTFMAALSQNRVASHLILAMCAMSAPFSQSPQVKSLPPRLAGIKFYEDALNILFDSSGRLICEANLQTVQTLCLLEMHDVVAQYSWTKCYRYLGTCSFAAPRGPQTNNTRSRHRYQDSFRNFGYRITGEPPFVPETDHPRDDPHDGS